MPRPLQPKPPSPFHRLVSEFGTLPSISPQLGRIVRTNSEAIVAVLSPDKDLDLTEAMLDVVRVREDFPILERRVHGDVPLIYLDSAATSQTPTAVITTAPTVPVQKKLVSAL